MSPKQKATFIVTGASSGIGKAVSDRLLNHDHHIIGIARRASEIRKPGYTAIDIDLADLKKLPENLAKLVQNHPQINGIIFCAGCGRFGSLEEFSYDQIRTLLELNLGSQIFLTRAYLPLLKKQKQADLVYIGSETALSGGKRGVVYSASKSGLRGFTRALRDECATNNIRVSLINPGMVRTPFFNDLDFSPGEGNESAIEAEDIAETVLSILQMRRGTVIDEVNLSPQKKVIEFGNKNRTRK